MGLAEPRKRVKIAHDPRNLAWTSATDSFGQRLMQQQGWKTGEALGARGRNKSYADTEAAKVNVQYKDNNLGLGATLKSKDVANQRTGFDAFQGLLGRLNAKSDEEVKAVEKKLEDKKLAMFAQGRWGGMVFVPGGILVQNDPYKQKLELEKQRERNTKKEEEAEDSSLEPQHNLSGKEAATASEKAQRKAEKRQRKEARRLRKEQRKASALIDTQETTQTALPTPEPSSSSDQGPIEADETNQKKRARNTDAETNVTNKTISQMRNGRHILRGRNILAKRAAFSDMKGLDEIFMKVS